MLKNKIIIKKIRNIFILLMAIIIMVGVYTNIRKSRAENVIQIEMEVSDKSNTLEAQTITVDATETKDGNYLLELPTSVNGNIVTKYYTLDGVEVVMSDENTDKTLTLTETEVANKKMQLQTDYDKKDVTTQDNQTVTLYNKELLDEKDNEEETADEEPVLDDSVIVTGYMPLDTQVDIQEIDLSTLSGVQLPNENQTMQKAYEVSVYQMVKKVTDENGNVIIENETSENTQSTENLKVEEEKVEYDPSIYDEELTIKTKNTEPNTKATIYNLQKDNQITALESVVDKDYIDANIEKGNETVKYVLATEPDSVQNQDVPIDSANNAGISTMALTDGNMLMSTSDEFGANSIFLGNPEIKRAYVAKVTFVSSTSGANSTAWDVSAEQNGSILAWYETTTINQYSVYKVYIGSNETIYANTDSSYLFNNIGNMKNSCIESELITNIDLLNTSKVTNMHGMFRSMGVGSANFKTFDLGDNFDTSNVTDMSEMFYNISGSNLTSLDLGDKFDTRKVTDMTEMFYNDYETSLTSLKLGKSFVNIADNNYGMFEGTGREGEIKIYVSENIFKDEHTFKLNQNSTTTIPFSRGTLIMAWEQTDTTAPTWVSNIGGGTYSLENKTYSFELMGTDDKELNSSLSVLSSSNVLIKVDGSTINSSDLVFGSATLNGDGKSKVFPITIKNFTGGNVTISISEGALVDTAGNKSAVQTYSFTIDGTAPEWNTSVSNETYSESAKTYSMNLIGSDETMLNNASSTLSSSNTTVKVDNVTVSSTNLTFGSATISTDGKTKTFPLTIKNYSGGTISISINKGALIDSSGNQSSAKTYSFTPAIDNIAPTWADNISNGTYSSANSTYSLNLVGSDNIKLDSTLSVLNSSKVSVKVNGMAVSSSNLTFGTASLSGDGKTKTFPLTIKNFTGGAVTITINAGALVDTTGNRSSQKIYTFTIDGTAPVWNSNISGGTYNSSDKTYSLKLIGSDETALNNSLSVLSSSNVTVKINNIAVSSSNLTFGTATLNDKAKTFPLTIKNFTGGTVTITINAGALVDTAGNTSIAKTYSFTFDVSKPVWNDQISEKTYSSSTREYLLKLVGTDETGLNDSLSILNSSNVSVTVNGTTVSTSDLTFGTANLNGNTKTFPLTIKNFTGGMVKITINSGALVDTSGNKSDSKVYTFSADVNSPTWINQTGTYNPDEQSYIITLTGSDDVLLDTAKSGITPTNSAVTVGGMVVSPEIYTISSTSTSETYQIKINNYQGGTVSVWVNEGVLIDAQGNLSSSETFTFQDVDATKPIWENNIIGGTYSSNNNTYTFSLKGTDETQLNNSASAISSSNVTIITSGQVVSSYDLVFGTPTLSSDGKSKTFPITINNFKGGYVSIAISSGALVDTIGNKSLAKSYTFFEDITSPIWEDDVQNIVYNETSKTYKFELVGTDETSLNDSLSVINGSNTTVTVGGSSASITFGTPVMNSEGTSKNFPITVNNYTGGEIKVTISANALTDSSSNKSIEKTYTITPDVTKPVWEYQNVSYDAENLTYSVELVGTDNKELNTNTSTLQPSGAYKNVSVTCGSTVVTPLVEKVSTSENKIIYKLTINNYPGGVVTINIDEGALVDTSSNESDAKTISLPAKDMSKPTLTVQNQSYSNTDNTYTFEIVATDETEIDINKSNLVSSGSAQNISVSCGDIKVNPTISIKSTTSKQIIYEVTINDYPSGWVSVNVFAGAIVDATGNKNNAATFTLPAEDVMKPEWQSNPELNYNTSNQQVIINLVGKDDTALDDVRSILTPGNNLGIYINGVEVSTSNIQIGNATVSADGTTKTFPITINNYTGGIIVVSISAGALIDESGKTSDAKTYEFTDMIKPQWSIDGNGSYNKVSKTYTLNLSASDDVGIATVDLTMSVTVGGVSRTITITCVNDTSTLKNYTVDIPNYTGGQIRLTIGAGTIIDGAGNTSEYFQTAFTPDVTAPTWKAQNGQYVSTGSQDVTVELVGTDDVLLTSSSLNVDDLIVNLDGNKIDQSRLSLSAVSYTNDGKGGLKYTLTISEYNSEAISIVVPADSLTDSSGNTNVETTLSIERILPESEDIKPVVSGIEYTQDAVNQTVTIEFDITDDSFDYSQTLEASDFTVTKTTSQMWGGDQTTTITPTITITEKKITKGKHFVVKLSDLNITGSSGWFQITTKLTVVLKDSAITDLFGNGNVQTNLMNNVTINFSNTASSAAISKKSVTLDKENKELILEITVNKNNTLWWGDWWNTGSTASFSESNIYDIKFDGVSVINSGIEKNVEFVSSSGGTGWWGWNNNTAVYRITLSNLEESVRQTGKEYKEWSGNVSFTLGTSTTNTITLEDDLTDRNTTDTLFADFIKPEIELNQMTINDDNANSVTLQIKATDKYYTPGEVLNRNNISLSIDGSIVNPSSLGIDISYGTANKLYNDRNGVSEQYGITQDITINGISDYIDKSIKLVFGEGTVIDLSDNKNESKTISLFNWLKSTNTEINTDSGFLGNTAIQRQNIQSVEFLNSTSTAPSSGTWDVSEEQNGSIIAWYTGTNPYRVYIASDGPIYANPDSSYLFSNIGYSSKCTDTEVIKNLNLLNTRFVTNMSNMFYFTGNNSMTQLDLGNNFDTSNVTDMSNMFMNMGQNQLISLDLGDKFDTSNVIDMEAMFDGTGMNKITNLNLGDKFDTRNVTNMYAMFAYCGTELLTSLDLGDKFNTSNVTNMNRMFDQCGYTSMTSLDLGPAFTNISTSNSDFMTSCGKSGSVKYYVPESIYNNSNSTLKLNTDSNTTVATSNASTIVPKYAPSWTKVSTSLDETNKTLTIKLQGQVNSADYGNAIKTVTNTLANGELTDNAKIKVKINNENADSIKKTVSQSNSGPAETVTAEIILSDFEQAVLQSGKSYMEWAGNVAVQLMKGTLVDAYGNSNLTQRSDSGTSQNVEIKETTNIEQNTANKMFADFVKPTVMYEYSNTTIDTASKSVKIVFSITDKYYLSESLDLSDVSILMDGTNLKDTPVQIAWAEENISENGKVIGRKYTATLTELEQDAIANGKEYLDYSGNITISIPKGVVTDKSGNTNLAKTITVGIDEPENPDHSHDTPVNVDVVNPTWIIDSNDLVVDFVNKKVTMTIKATDKYFETSTLTSNNITLYLGGVATTTGITKTVSSPTPLMETRMVNGVSQQVQYGNEYTVTITGITLNSTQGKIRIAAGTARDTSGNVNEAKDVIIYNRLRSTNTETSANSGFLGRTSIQRQNIYNVTFETYIASDVYNLSTKQITNTTRAWDVSAAGDQSIVAWYEDSEIVNGAYKIHIGSEGGILANADASYLFANIGSSTNCTSETVISNLRLLDVSSVTNMNYMFDNTGSNAMTQLDLGDNFDTSSATTMVRMFQRTGYSKMVTLTLGNKFNTANVTDMNNMFNETGYREITSLDLGSLFDTSKVTNMERMFRATGYYKMTGLNLGNSFNTSSVNNMYAMFESCGYTKLESLDLGNEFNTQNVTTMENMFNECGYIGMTSLNLGNLFNTNNVTNMSGMFQNTGSRKMESLELGSSFNTSKVTNMSYMFYGTGSSLMSSLSLGGLFYTNNVTNMTSMFETCGEGNMTSLDLGPAFTNIASTNTNMFSNCGSLNNIKIYTGSAIYKGVNEIRLNLNSNTTVNFTRGEIVLKYQPQWTKSTTAQDTLNSALTVTLNGSVDSTNYAGYNQGVINKFTNGTTSQIIASIDGELESNDIITKTISGANSTESENVQCDLKLTGFKEGYDSSKGYTEWSGNVELQIPQGTLMDSYGNPNLEQQVKEESTDRNAIGKLFLDSIKPEISYEYADTTISYDAQTVTIGFSIKDKYFDNNVLTNEQIANQILVKMKDDGTNATEVNKQVSEIEDIYATVNGQNRLIGKKYELVISNLDQGDGVKYSGPMQIVFPSGMVQDKSGQGNDAKTITIGIDDPTNHPEHDSDVVVDVVKPIWTAQNLNISQISGKTQVTMELIGTDKYLDKDASEGLVLDANDIKVMIDGVDISNTATEITKTLSDPVQVSNGIKYVFTIANLEESYDAFMEARNSGDRVYREYSGNLTVEIPENTLVDESGNKSAALTVQVGDIDTLKPEIVKVSSNTDITAKTETIVFDVTDKYFSTVLDEQTLLSKLHVFVDDEVADSVTKQITNVETLTDVVDGVTSTVGKRYTLVLSDFEQAGLQNGYQFKGISGTVKVNVDEGIATDTKGNTSDAATLQGDLSDFIEPSVIYKYTKPDEGAKSVNITFDVTDKYYESGDLTLADLTIKMQNGTDLSNYIDLKTVEGATLTLSAPTNIVSTTAMNKTVDGIVQTGLTNQVIGRRYTLTISGLEQSKILDGDKYLEYSGNLTISIEKGKVKDTSNNGNVAQTITFGIDLPEGTGTEEVLDIVNPIWTVDSQVVDLDNQEATIVITGTDKYFRESTLTDESIELWINGEQVEKNGSTGREVRIQSQEEIYEDWIENGVTSRHLVGVKYTIKASGFEIDEGQVKIKIPSETLKDYSGNKSEEIEFMLYSCLKATNTETLPTSGFLGNNSIQRQNIENITFVSGMSEANSTKWDVSAGNDGSIMAWYETTSSGALKVYIGGKTAMFANPDSRYLFANIGTASKCTQTETITNLDLLTTKQVQDMSYMFYNTGTNAMTSLDLGDKFDTRNVKNMSYMFYNAGKNKMTSLNLGTRFDTSVVTDMSSMFYGTGSSKMTSLDLGDNFNTKSVINMSYMFYNTGADSMTSLDLGDNFNTSSVTNMSYMFYNLGKTSMTNLDLKDKFYTSNATNMEYMFYGTGENLMTNLDLGPAFTKIAIDNTNFVTNCGKSGAIIYAPEAIYQDENNFRLDGEGSSAISYTRGTINAKYRTEWTIEAASIDKNNKSVTIKLRGSTNSQISDSEYPTDVMRGLIDSNKIKVYIDGTEITSVEDSIQIEPNDYEVNENGRVEVLQNIVLSNFEETVRQAGKNYTEWSGNISLEIEQDSGLRDTYGNGNQNISQSFDNITFADFIKPEFTYNYSSTDIDNNQKTLTVDFSITDKYFSSSTVLDNKDNIIVKMLDTNAVPENITKTLTKLEDISETRNGTAVKIGEKYRLVITGFEQATKTEDGKYKEYSGPVSIEFPAEIAKDTSDNQNNKTNITVGVNIPDNTGNPEIVDFVSPIWEAKNLNIDKINKKATVDLYGTDKYFKNSTLDINKIKVIVDGEEITSATSVVKQLSTPTALTENRDGASVQYGVKYTLTLSNWKESDEIFQASSKRYREYSGNTQIVINAGTLVDESGNQSKETSLDLGHIDIIDPEVYQISSTKNEMNKTDTIIFDVVDKYFESSKITETDTSGLTVYVDDEEAIGVTKNIVKIEDIKATINGSERKIGERYTLVISNFEQERETPVNYDREYSDWSGNVTVKVAPGLIEDSSGNTN